MEKEKTPVVILGGGVGGILTALKLTESGIKTYLIEEKEGLLEGTSAITPGRMGLGFHYHNLATGKRYLEAIIDFCRKNPGIMLGEDLGKDHYLRHGRYVITNDSQLAAKTVLRIYEKLREHYADLIKRDPQNKIYGEPKDFFRILKQEEYETYIKKHVAQIVVETQEHLLNLEKFKKKLLHQVNTQPLITVYCGYKVTKAERDIKNPLNFHITVKNKDNTLNIYAPYVVNATWGNIEEIKENLFDMPKKVRTNRLKLLAEIELPSSLRQVNSTFFCMGPFCMFSNMGNGKGKITFAKVTNYGWSMDRNLPLLYKKWLSEGLSSAEERAFGEKIINGIAEKYMPLMKDAKLLKVYPGIIVTEGTVDLDELDSDVHSRDYSGVREIQIGWIDNACMKLLYCYKNGEEV